MTDLADENLDQDGRLALALRASNEGIWDWWTDREDIYYSSRIFEFLKYPAEAIPNPFLPDHPMVHPDDLENFERCVQAALAPGGPELLSIDARLKTGAGSWIWMRIRGSVVRDPQGRAERIAGSMIDITRRKSAETQVAEDEHLLRQLIDHVPLQVYFKDQDSRFVLANFQMAEWMGLQHPSELVGRHDRDFFDEQHAQQAADDEALIMRTREPISAKLEREDWDAGKSDTWVLSSKFPWFDRHGRVKGTFGVSSDVTELVQAKQSSAKLAQQLQRKNELLLEEVHLAKEIQHIQVESEIPPFSYRRDQVEFTSRFIPHTGLAGDFYKVIPISPSRIGLLICDVMGHGVRSALVVAMIHGLLERQAASAHLPAAYLGQLNATLHSILERSETTIFCTAFYGVIDLEKQAFTFTSAGHPPALLRHQNGQVSSSGSRESRGPGLGLMPDSHFRDESIPLEGIDSLLLYTDGLTECESADGEALGCDGLGRLLAGTSKASPSAKADELIEGAQHFSAHGHFDDDVCLLMAQLSTP